MSKRRKSQNNASDPLVEDLNSSSKAPPTNASTSQPTGSDWKTALRIAVFLAGLSTAYTIYRRIGEHTVSSTGRVTRLPESYAVCTAEARRVYTVVDDAPRVDCLLVSRDRVMGAGTIGVFIKYVF